MASNSSKLCTLIATLALTVFPVVGCTSESTVENAPSEQTQRNEDADVANSDEGERSLLSGTEEDEYSWLIDAVAEAYPGYPMLVSLESIDDRIAEKFYEDGATKAVAILPALYMPYNPAIPDLNYYLLNPSGVRGNSLMKDVLQEATGWFITGGFDSRYMPGTEEPAFE